MSLTQQEKNSPKTDYKYVEVQNLDQELDNCMEKRNYTQEYITTIISTLGIIVCGIQFTWISPVLPQLLSGSFKIKITMEESVWVNGFSQVGYLPGSIVASIISKKYGRKKIILMTTIPFLLSSLVNIYAETVTHYYISRFLGGFGFGANLLVVPIYISEISSPEIRGILSTSIHVAMSIGILFVFILGAYLPIVTYCIVLTIFPIIQLIFTFYLPETPYFLVMKQDYCRAEKTLRFLRKKSNVQEELNRLIDGYKEEITKKSFWDLFTDRTNLKSVIIIIVLRAVQIFTGFTAINGYSQVILEDGHSIISPEICGIFLALTNFAVTFLLLSLVERLGRRVLLLISGIITLIPWTMLGGYFYLQDNFVNIEYLKLIPFISIVFFKVSFGIGLNSIPFILAVELFPTSVKTYASTLNSVCLTVFAVLSNKMYQVVLDEYNYSGVFGMYVILLILGIIFMYFTIPETKGLTLEEIQIKLRKSNKSRVQNISN